MSNRRDFLKKAGGLALLTIVPRSVLGGTKFVAPSDQLTKGIIGVDVHADLPEVCRVLGENHLKKVPVLDEATSTANTLKAPSRWAARSSTRPSKAITTTGI